MSRIFSRYATPLMTGLFVVSLVSGLLLFVHVGPAGLHGMHEWLSLLLILPFALHVWKNWRPMTAYFRHAPMVVALAASAAMAGVFLLPAGAGGEAGRVGPPAMQLGALVMQATPAEMAPVLDTTPEALVARLTAAGFAVTGPDMPLTEVAAASGRTAQDLAAVLIAPQG